MFVELTHDPIDIGRVLETVSDPAAGAVATFLGTVRNHHRGRAVRSLRYEAYEPMARSRLKSILEEASGRWSLRGMAVVHRLGVLGIGDTAVAVAVSSDHRAASFEACRNIMERIKTEVPIWKHEVFEDGDSAWVGFDLPAADRTTAR